MSPALRRCLVTTALLALAPHAYADPITISRGTVTLGSPASGQNPPFGFELVGENTAINGETSGFGIGGGATGQVVDLSTPVMPSSRNFRFSKRSTAWSTTRFSRVC